MPSLFTLFCRGIRTAVVVALLSFRSDMALIAQGRSSPSTLTANQERAATAARERGDIPASLTLYQTALVHTPSWQEGWWYYGSLLYDENRYSEAAKAFRKLVTLNDQLGNAWGMLGLSEFEIKDYKRSFQDLGATRRTAVTDPSLEKVVDYHLALLLNTNVDPDSASVLLSSLYVKGVRSEDLQVAMGLCLLRIPVLPANLDPSHDALVHDAGNLAALLATRQYEKATLSFENMLTRYPTVPFLHYAYGNMLAAEGHDTDAKAQFRAETELTPDSVVPYLEWAFVAMKTKDYVEAKRLSERAATLDPSSFLAHYILGNSLLLAGDPQGALPELETAKQLAPQAPDVRYSLSRAHARLGQTELARQEQAQFLALQRKNAVDRLDLLKRYPGAQPITGVRPTTSE